MNFDALKKAAPVRAGQDRFHEHERMIWGLIPLSIKLSGQDTGGEVLLFEHRDMGKGGPPRHVHFEQDEWFYVVKGEFVFEVGGRPSTSRGRYAVRAAQRSAWLGARRRRAGHAAHPGVAGRELRDIYPRHHAAPDAADPGRSGKGV